MARLGRSFPATPRIIRQLHQDNSRTAVVTDVQNLTDSQSAVKSLTATVTDALGLTDSTSKSLAKIITDALGLVDSKALSFSKVLADSINLTDALTVATVKYVTDTIGLQDSVNTTLSGSVAWEVVITDAFGSEGGKMFILVDGEYLAVKISPNLYMKM